MSLNPAVWIILKGTGEVLYRLPSFSSLPSEGDGFVISKGDEVAVAYKVKGVKFVAQVVEQMIPFSPDIQGVNAHVEIEVSEL